MPAGDSTECNGSIVSMFSVFSEVGLGGGWGWWWVREGVRGGYGIAGETK